MNEKIASQTIRLQKDALAEAIVARQYDLQPELWQPYGQVGRAKSVRDVGFHLDYLVEALHVADRSLFIEYLKWVKVLFAGLNFPAEVLEMTLQCTGDVFREQLPPAEAAAAGDYIAAGLRYLSAAPATAPSFIQAALPLGDLAAHYLDALLKGERHAAGHLILEAVERGIHVKDIYLQVFQPVQHETGRLWQINKISVAQEHYCTAATQFIMAQLYPYIFASEKSGRRLVATCVGGELHEMGVRMVADFFEMAGWDTYYLGANTPDHSVVEMVRERRAEALAISATMPTHISKAGALIAQVRASIRDRAVKILVGGYPFNLSPDLWRTLGADGYAPNAQEAIAVANRLVAGEEASR